MQPKFVKKAIYSLKKQKIDWNYLYLSDEASCQKKNEEKKIKQMHRLKYFQLLLWPLILVWYVDSVWYEKRERNIPKRHEAFL